MKQLIYKLNISAKKKMTTSSVPSLFDVPNDVPKFLFLNVNINR